MNADKDGVRNNSISINSNSINNNIIVTKIFDLGLIFTGSGNVAESAFDTSNTINIKNTNIDIDGDFSLSSSNQNIADSSLDTQGTLGIICIWNEATSENILNASDIINFENSNITANNIDIQTSTFAGTKVGKTVEAVVHSVVGIVLVSHMAVKNTVTENSEVNLVGTNLTAYKDINITTDTNSYIHQEAETKADFGILTFANNSNKASITNNNKLTLDPASKIIASNETNISMNTSNDIKVHSYSDSTNIGGDAGANAEIHLTSNKTVDNIGSIEAGNLVNIVFDKTSDNTLEQHAEAYAYGVADSSDADGGIWYDPNNILNVAAGADITSGKNIIIDYNFGNIYTRTDNYSETDFLWCIPITDHAVNEDIHVNKGLQKMTLNGIVKAGQGSQRYLKINRDGTVEEAIGFYAGDYEIVDAAIISGDEIKEQLINKYTNEKTRLEGIKAKDETKRDEYIAQKDANDEIIETINDAIEPWEDTPVSTESELMSMLAHIILPGEYDEIMAGMVEYSSVASYFNSDIYASSGLNFTDAQKTDLSKDPSTQDYQDAFNALTRDKQLTFRSSYKTFTDSLTFDGYIDSKTDIDPALKATLKNAHKTFTDNTSSVDMFDKPNAFLAYTNDGYKCIVSNKKTTDPDYNPIKPYKDKRDLLTGENDKLSADIQALNITLGLLSMDIHSYELKIEETEAKTFPDEVVNKSAYYFKNIDSIIDSKIEVKGIANTKIEGTGDFIGASAGLKIDNYSSYDLIFKDIDMNTFGNGLFIDNKDYTSYMNQPQSVNKDGVETEGVHYKTDIEVTPEQVVTGITVNNFYDNNHPFASTFDIPNPTVSSNIITNGILRSNDSLYIWNESGFIEIKSNDYKVPNNVNLLSTNDSVYVDIGTNANSVGTKFSLNSDNLIFAASGVTIKADEVDIKGNIKSGYSDRKITITEGMLNNLIYDPASDETNLINLGGNPVSPYLNDPSQYGNIKAIYKDNTIYLYSVPDQGLDSSIKITKSDGTPSSGSITGQLTAANGYKNIEITNNTTKDMIIKNINNVKISGTIKTDNIEAAEGTKTITSKESAVTAIVSGGNLTLDGVINNNVIRGVLNGKYAYIPDNTETKGELTVSAADNANIKITRQVESGNIIDSIFAGGNIDILTDNGAMDILGNITSKYGNISIQTTDISDGNNMTITAAIKNEQGNTMIENNGAGRLQLAGSITNQDGSTSVINNSSHFIYTGTILNNGGDTTLLNANGMFHIYGDIKNSGGDINITSNGSSTEITHSIINEALSVTDGNNNTTTTSGSINITAISTTDTMFNFRILDSVDSSGPVPTIIKNTSYDDNKGITITHNAERGVIQIDADIISTDKGSISITNSSRNNAEINGKISASDGNITVTNNYTGSSADKGNTNINGAIETVTGDVSITNNNRGNVTVSAIKVSEGDINIETTNSKNTLIKGNIENKVGGDITIYQENSGMINVISDIYQTDGVVSIKSKNSGYEEQSVIPGGYITRNIAIQLAPQSSITSRKGNILIHNDGDSDIYQSGSLIAYDGNVTVTNTEGEIYSYGDILTTGDITIANHDGDLVMDALYGTTSGNIGILNLHGNLIIDDNALILNLSAPEDEGKITIVNYDNSEVLGMYIDGYIFNNSSGDITITNQGTEGAFISGVIESENGDINITNYTKILELTGEITADKGDISIRNTGDMELDITTDATINAKLGDIKISNTGADGLDVQGIVKADKGDIKITNENSDLRIGEYTSDNDNYINSVEGNTIITQTGGNILNSITDPANRTHSNYNIGNPNNAYKTLITTGGYLTLNVTDGSIGFSDSTNPGYSINAPTRDYTDSINVNVSGNVTAIAVNSSDTSTDKQLINLRAKESDLNIKEINSDGNVILTAADWRQADINPTPDDDNYFRGYSILNGSDDNSSVIKGQNISIIASNNIGTETKNVTYEQDTLRAPDSWASFEAENDLYLTTRTNSSNEARIYQIISKRGSTELDMEADTYIDEITAGGKLKLTQEAQNLTIKKLGYSPNEERLDDMLYPHDNIAAGGGSVVAPKCAIIKVLDAIDTPERSDSNLKIYSAYVTGNNGDDAHYYPDGSRLADYTLIADNIYANSYKAPNSNVSTKAHPSGYKQTDRTYTDTDIEGADSIVHYAEGLNVIGDGKEISIDVLGVDKDDVDALIPNAQRNYYSTKKHDSKTPDEFKNKYDRLAFYGYDFSANEVVLSVNDYADADKIVSLDTIYANNAYINTPASNLKVEDGIITNYAEFRNKTKLAVVDNDYRRIVNSDMQLFTKKTGSFSMGLSNSTIMKTVGPVVDFNPYHLVNTYSSENSFVHLTFKETTVQQHNKEEYKELKRKNDYYNKSVSLVFNTLGCGLLPENEVYEISRTGAVIDANNLKIGQEVNIKLKFNDIDTNVEAKVKEIHGNKATVEFLNCSDEISNTLLYEYMKKINAMKNSISSL